jgi:hypothetical protein
MLSNEVHRIPRVRVPHSLTSSHVDPCDLTFYASDLALLHQNLVPQGKPY